MLWPAHACLLASVCLSLYLSFSFSLSLNLPISHSRQCLDGERPIKAANSSYTVPARIVLGRALEHLARSAKNNIASSGLPDRPLHWIITVPRNEAYPLLKSAMKEVYELVSSNHSFVLETEGAIIACREELMEVWRKRGEPKAFPVMLANCGKTNVDFVVLDAGATMAMKTMAPVQRMSGGAWGEQMVIAAIEQFVMRAIGAGACKMISEEDWLSFKREITEKTFSLVAHSLERLVLVPPCSMYAAIREETSTFPYGVRFSRGRLIFDSSVLQQLFEPSLAHISDQTKRLLDTIPGIHCILLVGRYAECPFLFERLHKQFNTPTLQVIRPCMASLAILKGAITLIQNQSVARK